MNKLLQTLKSLITRQRSLDSILSAFTKASTELSALEQRNAKEANEIVVEIHKMESRCEALDEENTKARTVRQNLARLMDSSL